MTGKGSYWRCRICDAIVTGIDWNEATKGKGSHPDPKGGHYRAVNFDQVPSPTDDEKARAVTFNGEEDAKA